MKKLITSICIAFTVSLFATTVLTKDSTEADFRSVLSEMAACTNVDDIRSINHESNFMTILNQRGDLKNLRLEADEILASKGFCNNFKWLLKKWPKISALCREKENITTNNIRYALGIKYDCDALYGSFFESGISAEDCIILMDYIFSTSNIDDMSQLKNLFQKRHGLPLIKKMLYKQGKSFVTKDGVNPCKEMMDELTNSLNAPRLAGFNEWLAKVGVNASITLKNVPSDEEIEELKIKVLTGETNATRYVLRALYLGLSTDDYNAFIKRYNGDK